MLLPPRLFLLFAVSLALTGAAQPAPPPAPAPVDTGDAHAAQSLLHLDPAAQVAARLHWWEEARFGMFIHWGLYAQWGSHYPGADGQLLDGKSEHMMRHLRLPLRLYSTIADVWHPTDFDPDAWVRVAREAGMKYIILTSKHHDGFAMFDSPTSAYNSVRATPWHRDAVAELAAACRRGGLRFGVYYSLGRDWQDPAVPSDRKADGKRRSNDWDWPDESTKDFHLYFERKVKPQVRELLTQYGPIDVLWFDTPEKIAAAESVELLQLIHQLQPACIVNQRVGNRYGDYRVAEQEIPAGGWSDPWETCMTLNRHWGYYLGDDDFKPVATVIRNLVDIASKGGNFLLNVGPTGDGIIPAGSVERLQQVGSWLAVNGTAIHGTTASDMPQPAWGRITARHESAGATTLYLHVFAWPTDGRLTVAGLTRSVSAAFLLADGTPVACAVTTEGQLQLTLPLHAPDPLSSTVVLQLAPR